METKKLFDLTGKVAIVTGGRGLYGASISRGLCEMGATVIVASRNGEKCEEFAGELRAEGYEAYGYSLDLGDDVSIKALCDGVAQRFGKIDVLVNNAVDRSNMVSFEKATRQKLQDSASINLDGQLLLAQVSDNCALMEQVRPLTQTELQQLHDAFTDIDPRVIDPRTWFNSF